MVSNDDDPVREAHASAKSLIRQRPRHSFTQALKIVGVMLAAEAAVLSALAASDKLSVHLLAISLAASSVGLTAFVFCVLEWARCYEHSQALKELVAAYVHYEDLLRQARADTAGERERADRLSAENAAMRTIADLMALGKQMREDKSNDGE